MLSQIKLITIMGAAVAALSAVEISIPPTDVFDDSRLIGLCVLGSIMGAFLASSIFSDSAQPQEKRVQRLSMRFGISMVSGVTFSPLVIRKVGMQISPDIVVGISGLVALVAVTSLQKVVPIVEEWIKTRRLP